ncbi:hypothetical protein FORC71_3398 [Vibrio parahaemolyticus]|nr:hypothetical protein FORC71_3398 [Vibrio parahaemolyticus]OCP67117.1 hypothetical protein AKH08_21425 [Vibrio parahaemolyticus]
MNFINSKQSVEGKKSTIELCQRIKESSSRIKNSQPQRVRLAYIHVNKIKFTNNVSWLGDPRLKKGQFI